MNTFLAITEGKGFQMTFKNNLTISVQFGIGNYCEKRSTGKYGCERESHFWDCDNAEIAVWDNSGDNPRFLQITKYDQVIGHLSPDEVAEWLNNVRLAKSPQELEVEAQSYEDD